MTKDKLIKYLNLPKIEDDGFLIFAQYPDHIPFNISRIYYITSPAKGLPRGKHAHKKNRQALFCIRGSVRMLLDDGKSKEEVILSHPERGIMIEPEVWHEMHDMDEDTILLVMASDKFDPGDYIRDYREFKEYIGSK